MYSTCKIPRMKEAEKFKAVTLSVVNLATGDCTRNQLVSLLNSLKGTL